MSIVHLSLYDAMQKKHTHTHIGLLHSHSNVIIPILVSIGSPNATPIPMNSHSIRMHISSI